MTPEEHVGAAIAAAATFNKYAPKTFAPPKTAGPTTSGDRPGDDFNARADWQGDVLGSAGWRPVGGHGGAVYWKRPGKDESGHSATTGHCRTEARGDLFYVFSTNAAPFESEQSYSKFEALTLLNFGGDFTATAKELAARGYGKQTPVITFPPHANGAAEKGPKKVFPPIRGDTENSNLQGGALPPPAEPFCRLPISALRKQDKADQWLWHGYFARNAITMFSAFWKAGKTTLLAHLLRAWEGNQAKFCGLAIRPAKVLLVTEEHESLWADRRDVLGLKDHVHTIVRPFAQKPKRDAWMQFLVWLQKSLAERPVDVVLFDTIAALWPVEKENDASEVQAALMPLRAVAENSALGIVHHLRKQDGEEATGGRGSGAFPAFVDIIVELRRYNAGDRKDRRRILKAYGRYEETPGELVIELTEFSQNEDGNIYPPEYRCLGDKSDCAKKEVGIILAAILPASVPGFRYEQIVESWPEESGKPPTKKTILDALHHGVELGLWHRSGDGKRNDPHLYFKPPATPFD